MKHRSRLRTLSLLLLASLLLSPLCFPRALAAGTEQPSVQLALCSTHAAALVDDALYLWGGNEVRQIIGQTIVQVPTPTKVATGIASVVLAPYCTMVIDQNANLTYYGVHPYTGYGSGPTGLRIAEGIADVAIGDSFLLFLKTDGTLWSMGSNSAGQLGTGDTQPREELTKIMDNVVSIAAGPNFSLALKSDHTLYGWGDNSCFQLNIGDASEALAGDTHPNQNVYTPTLVASDVVQMSAGELHTCVVKSNGDVWVCGSGEYGQVGNGSSFMGDNLNYVLANAVSVSAGSYHNLGLVKGNRLFVWGLNDFGQLGGWAGDTLLSPNELDLPGVIAAAAGTATSIAVTSDGTLWAWGSNTSFLFGVPRPSSSMEPIAVTKLFDGPPIQGNPNPTPTPTPSPDPSTSPDPTNPSDPSIPPIPGDNPGHGTGSDSPAFVNGYTDGTFKPEATVTRSEFVKMLVVAAGLYDPTVDYGNAFPDVPKTDWASNHIACARVMGITTGHSDGNFHPLATISRGEAATMIARAYRITGEAGSSLTFPDLPSNHWAAASVGALAKKGIITGYTDGTFRPSGSVHRCEAVSMLLRAQGNAPSDAEAAQIRQTAASPFTDLAPSYWAYPLILRAAGQA